MRYCKGLLGLCNTKLEKKNISSNRVESDYSLALFNPCFRYSKSYSLLQDLFILVTFGPILSDYLETENSDQIEIGGSLLI